MWAPGWAVPQAQQDKHWQAWWFQGPGKCQESCSGAQATGHYSSRKQCCCATPDPSIVEGIATGFSRYSMRLCLLPSWRRTLMDKLSSVDLPAPNLLWEHLLVYFHVSLDKLQFDHCLPHQPACWNKQFVSWSGCNEHPMLVSLIYFEFMVYVEVLPFFLLFAFLSLSVVLSSSLSSIISMLYRLTSFLFKSGTFALHSLSFSFYG